MPQAQITLPSDAKWNLEGRTTTGGRNHGSGPGHVFNNLRAPGGLVVTPQQTVSVADTLHHCITERKRESRSGRRIAGQRTFGYGSQMLCAPSDIAFHEQSDSYLICDYHNRRVVQRSLKPDVCLKTLIDGIACSGIATDSEGFIYVSDTKYHVVKRYDPKGKGGIEVAGGNGQGGRLKQLNHPTYLFVGSDQAVYVSDSGNNRVVKWSKGAKAGVLVAGGKGKGKDYNQLDYPAGLVVDAAGTVYVADHWNHRVVRWPQGAASGEVIVGSHFLSGDTKEQLNCPQGLAFDQEGNLYVSDSGNNRVQQFSIDE